MDKPELRVAKYLFTMMLPLSKWNKANKELRESFLSSARKLLSLLPDIEELNGELRVGNQLTATLTDKCRALELQIEEVKREERERIISYLEFMVWVFNPEKERSEFLGIIQELKSGLWEDGQALKEEK